MPPILAGAFTQVAGHNVERFYLSVGEIFEAWVNRRKSPHTRRAYREDVMAFIDFLGIEWPKRSFELLTASIKEAISSSLATPLSTMSLNASAFSR